MLYPLSYGAVAAWRQRCAAGDDPDAVRAKTFPKRLRHYSKPQASDSLAFVRLAPSGRGPAPSNLAPPPAAGELGCR